MRKSCVIITTAERFVSALVPMLESIERFDPLKGWSVYIVAQGYDKPSVEGFKRCGATKVITEAYFTSQRLGPFGARDLGMRRWSSDLWLALDDDMLMTEYTNYNSSTWLEYAQRPGVGVVMGQSANNNTMLQKMVDKFCADKIDRLGALMSTGGGIIYNDEVARALLTIPNKHYVCDNTAWSVGLYKEGYIHYAYKGSWVIHKAGSKGGLRAYLSQERVLPWPSLIEWVPEKNRKLLDRHPVCRLEWVTTKHLKPLLHEMHRQARQEKGFDHDN